MTSPRRQTTNSHSGPDRGRDADIVTMPATPQPSVYEREARAAHAERIGDILRRTRERRGDDLHRIAEYLCIRRGYLEAIETSDYDKFPADAYVIGFLRSYADLLGLDGKEAINLYRAEMIGRRKKPVLSMPTPMPEGRSPSALVLIGAVVTAIMVYALWYGFSTSDRATVSTPVGASSTTLSSASTSPVADATINAVNVPPVPTVPVVPPAAAPVAAVPAAPVTPVVESAPLSKPAASSVDAAQDSASVAPVKSTHLVIRAEQSSWVMIADSKGDTVFDRVLKPGEVYKVPDGPGLTLTTGNGAGLVLTLDGVDLPKLSGSMGAGSSNILRNIPLDGPRLRAATRRD